MHGLFGSVNPRVTDDLYAILFPAGWLSLFLNAAVLSVVLLLHGLATWLARSRGLDARNARRAWAEIGLLLSLGLLVVAVTLAAAVYWLVKTRNVVIAVKRDARKGEQPGNRQDRLDRAKAIALGVAWWVVIVSWFTLPAGMYFLFSAYTFWYYMVSYLVVTGLGLGQFITGRVSPARAGLLSITLPRRARTSLRAAHVVTLVAFATVFLSSAVIRVHPPPPDAITSTGPATLTLMSYNIRYASTSELNPANNWPNRRSFFTSYVSSFSADIIGVQEALYEQLEYMRLTMDGNYQYTGFGRDDGIRGGEHSSIFFDADRIRFVDGDTFWLGDFPGLPVITWGHSIIRVCTWARFEVIENGAQFLVFNTHYETSQWYNIFHERASVLVKDRIDAHSGGLPVFLMGDFNMNNETGAFDILLHHGQRQLVDTYTGNETNTFNGWGTRTSGRRIDFILASPDVTTHDAWIPKDYYGDGLPYSDHYPVLATCTF